MKSGILIEFVFLNLPSVNLQFFFLLMKKVLVLYYSQSGQMREILQQLTASMGNQVALIIEEIKPQISFPFPWTTDTFFDAMPESVLQIPPEIEPMPAIEGKQFDLVILGYQPWFLSPSQPLTGFLRSRWAATLKDTPVITVIGCRNMWLNAQEKVKADLMQIGAKLCGNIVLEDRHSNLTALKSITRWMFSGQKKVAGKPEAGVATEEIKACGKFALPVLDCLKQNRLETLQESLLALNAVQLRPNLIVMEKRGISQFPKWAEKARARGLPGSAERKPVIKSFSRLLIVAIFVLSPVTNTIAALQTTLRKKKLMKEVAYFKSIRFETGKL